MRPLVVPNSPYWEALALIRGAGRHWNPSMQNMLVGVLIAMTRRDPQIISSLCCL